jgi:hypothetical protein
VNWPVIYTALEQLAALSDLPAAALVWQSQAQASKWAGGARIVMRVGGPRQLGQDIEVLDDPAVTTDPELVSIQGQRAFTWTLRAESANAAPDKMALVYLDRVRARLERTSIQPILQSANIAISQVMPAQEVRVVSQDRKIDAYAMDVIVLATENDADTTVDSGYVVETVHLQSDTVKDTDGTPVSPQIDETITG